MNFGDYFILYLINECKMHPLDACGTQGGDIKVSLSSVSEFMCTTNANT